MRRLEFVKMAGAGNDFVVIDGRLKGGGSPRLRSGQAMLKGWSRAARFFCRRRTGIGADGLLVLEKSRKADFKISIFNTDGSEAEMCGNGLRCAALYACGPKRDLKIETRAGIYEARITGENTVRIKMAVPKDLRLDLSLKVNNRRIKVHYIDAGVPHTVIFVRGIEEIDVDYIGKKIRYHSKFEPRGTNVDFVEIIDDKNIKMRTYERGVEGETLACGTGAVAAAIVSMFKVPLDFARGRQGSPRLRSGQARLPSTSLGAGKVNVRTQGGVLKVYFNKADNGIKDVYLEGAARRVFSGTLEM